MIVFEFYQILPNFVFLAEKNFQIYLKFSVMFHSSAVGSQSHIHHEETLTKILDPEAETCS